MRADSEYPDPTFTNAANPVSAHVAYAPPPPWYRRTWARRLTVVLLVAPVLAALPHWGPPLRHHLQTLSWQRRCMNESPDAREVAYEEDPAAAAALAAADARYVALRSGGSPVVRFSGNWEKFYALMSPPGRRPGATLFLHARRAPGAAARLVAVDATFPDPAGRSSISLNTTVIEPGSLVTRPRVVGTGGTTLSPRAGVKLRFFSGQADPKDPSHFRIPYEVDGQPGAIDGWLRGDAVRLEIADGPASRFGR